MKTYIALLRGINVGGKNSIKMEFLRNVLKELDIKNISTYIQSGNIIFQSKTSNTSILENQISDKIEKHFSLKIPVIIVTLEELKLVVKNNPFVNSTVENSMLPYVAFLSETPSPTAIEILNSIDFGKDEFKIISNQIYLFYATSASKTKLTNVTIENKLKVKATSRNWKTVNTLITLADK